MMPLNRRSFVCATLLLGLMSGGLLACASGGASDGSTPTSSNRDLISSEELRELPPMDALQAVRRLRARWIQARNSGAPSVHVDGRFTGGLGVLEGYPIREVEQLRFRPARDATTLYGTNYPAGVIEITTRRSEEH